MRIVLLCATARGLMFLEKLKSLQPECDLVVFSFPEESSEPPFLENIRSLTEKLGGKFFEGRHPGNEKWNELWDSMDIDLILAVNWRYMLSERFYGRAKFGAFVFHDSLLPEYRGFSPTVWAIINGENHTGVTLFQMSDAVDAGDIIDQQSVPISTTDTIGTLVDRVSQTYLHLLEKNLHALITGTAPRFRQDHSRATYTCKRYPEDNQIQWHLSTAKIYNLIRGVSAPYSGAFTYLNNQKLKIWAAEPIEETRHYIGSIPGKIVEVRNKKGSVILTGDGMLLVTSVQLDGSGAVCAAEVLNHIGQTLR